MSNPSKFLKNIKNKTAFAVAGATLLAMPGGVALAHGSYHHYDGGRYDSYHSSYKHDNYRRSKHQANCDERQTRADQAVAGFKDRMQKHFNGLNIYLANQQAFVTNNNVTVKNYNELNARAINKQDKVTQALNDIQPPTINCDWSARHDKSQIYGAEQQLRHTIKKYETAVADLSIVIADEVKSS